MAKESRKLIANNKKAFHDYFIEDTWGVEITQKDLTLYPMNSIQEIAQVVARKL